MSLAGIRESPTPGSGYVAVVFLAVVVGGWVGEPGWSAGSGFGPDMRA
jgi:hypothetical protein